MTPRLLIFLPFLQCISGHDLKPIRKKEGVAFANISLLIVNMHKSCLLRKVLSWDGGNTFGNWSPSPKGNGRAVFLSNTVEFILFSFSYAC